jgi:hypothetical protein
VAVIVSLWRAEEFLALRSDVRGKAQVEQAEALQKTAFLPVEGVEIVGAPIIALDCLVNMYPPVFA